jgi:hypothetical protein
VGDYYSGMAKTGSPRWVRGENNWRATTKKKRLLWRELHNFF